MLAGYIIIIALSKVESHRIKDAPPRNERHGQNDQPVVQMYCGLGNPIIVSHVAGIADYGQPTNEGCARHLCCSRHAT